MFQLGLLFEHQMHVRPFAQHTLPFVYCSKGSTIEIMWYCCPLSLYFFYSHRRPHTTVETAKLFLFLFLCTTRSCFQLYISK